MRKSFEKTFDVKSHKEQETIFQDNVVKTLLYNKKNEFMVM